MPLTTPQLFWLLALGLTALSAVRDVQHGLIPNRLLLAAAVLGLVLHAGFGAAAGGVSGVLSAILHGFLGSVACALLPLLLYALGGLGGGDVKLFAALGLLTGPLLGLEVQLYAFALGGVYAGARLAYEGLLLSSVWRSLMLLIGGRRDASIDLSCAARTIRFAPAICGGALLMTAMHWSAP